MTPEQKAAHLRLCTTLPKRKHESRTGHEMKGGRNYIERSTVEEWIELRKQGYNGKEIADMYGVSKGTVNAYFRKHDGR
jgi:DNA-binding NarL/FixJ family response regulator